MILQSLSLSNFRNFKKLNLEFDPKVTILVGPNACGKTNILEAIYFLSLGKTFRPGSDFEVVNFEYDTAYIEAKIKAGQEEQILEVGIQKAFDLSPSRKKFSVNKIGKLRSNFIGNLKVILFSPIDLEMVDNSPSVRRAHLDDFLSQTDRVYHRILSSYEKTVASRNRILKRIFEGKAKEDELEFWDRVQVRLADEITKKRAEFFEFLKNSKGKLDDFSWVWKSSKVDLSKLKKERKRDIICQATISGPHRDDFRFYLSDRDLSFFGSRGQQRMSVLNLKLLELKYLEEKTGQKPVLLLDDIFSELDEEHRRAILPLPPGQAVITTTEIGNIDRKITLESLIMKLPLVHT